MSDFKNTNRNGRKIQKRSNKKNNAKPKEFYKNMSKSLSKTEPTRIEGTSCSRLSNTPKFDDLKPINFIKIIRRSFFTATATGIYATDFAFSSVKASYSYECLLSPIHLLLPRGCNRSVCFFYPSFYYLTVMEVSIRQFQAHGFL